MLLSILDGFRVHTYTHAHAITRVHSYTRELAIGLILYHYTRIAYQNIIVFVIFVHRFVYGCLITAVIVIVTISRRGDVNDGL